MNKFAKGSLAAGAGLVLLLGGAGTLAYWNSEAELQGGTINAGQLSLEVTENGWSQDITDWVPGDSSAYQATLDLFAQGDNIQGTVTFDESSVLINGTPLSETPAELAEQFDIDVAPVDADSLPAGVVFDPATDVFTFEGAVDGEIPVQITVDFPFDEGGAQNSSQSVTVDFTGVNFTATQTDPNA